MVNSINYSHIYSSRTFPCPLLNITKSEFEYLDDGLDDDKIFECKEAIKRYLPGEIVDPENNLNCLQICANSCLKQIRKLALDCLERGADPNAIYPKTRKTALHRACEHLDSELTEALLRYGADRNLQDESSRKPLWYALRQTGPDFFCSKAFNDLIQEENLSSFFDKDPLWLSVLKKGGNIQRLVDRIEDLDQKNSKEETGLEIISNLSREGNAEQFKALLLKGARFEKTPKQTEMLLFLCQKIIQRGFSEAGDVDFFQFLDQFDLLPQERLDTILFPQLKYFEHIKDSRLPKEIADYQKIEEILSLLKDEESCVLQYRYAEELQTIMERLPKDGFLKETQAQWLDRQIQKHQEIYLQILHDLERLEKEKDQHKVTGILNNFFCRQADAVIIARSQQKSHLIPLLLQDNAGVGNMNPLIAAQATYNFELDKSPIKIPGGGNVYQNAIILINSLQQARKLKLPAPAASLLDEHIDQIEQSLYLCAELDQQNSKKMHAIRICEELCNPDCYLLLIPAQTNGHAMSLGIQKQADKVTISLYNTGSGLRAHHSRYQPMHLHQTFLSFENIDLSVLSSIELWIRFQEVCDASSKNNSFNPLYDFIENELAKSGHRSPINSEQPWFEAPQKAGSCSAQNLMAFLRHTIMMRSSGNGEEKLGIYKMIKPFLFQWLDLSIDPKYGSVFDLKAKKNKANQRVVEIASNETRFQREYESLSEYCAGFGVKLEALGKDASIAIKVMALKKVSRIASNYENIPDGEAFILAQSLADSRAFREAHHQTHLIRLKSSNSIRELNQYLYDLLRGNTRFFARDWVLKHVFIQEMQEGTEQMEFAKSVWQLWEEKKKPKLLRLLREYDRIWIADMLEGIDISQKSLKNRRNSEHQAYDTSVAHRKP